ncbi:unnamed protein product [Enterobius vermicularis]|uniref:BPTI/Kunitz inhibitor domain-containing protein n=1 Tax=Enterobius vermicularis TaxID=51028 RepID=A0A0N4V3T5_ENTVE|nr:unnamed protein product [Enterobius vermicularis]
MGNIDLALLCIVIFLVHFAELIRIPPAKCNSALDRGPCKNFTSKWYYDRYSKQCRSFFYGGCQGNGNLFDSLEGGSIYRITATLLYLKIKNCDKQARLLHLASIQLVHNNQNF